MGSTQRVGQVQQSCLLPSVLCGASCPLVAGLSRDHASAVTARGGLYCKYSTLVLLEGRLYPFLKCTHSVLLLSKLTQLYLQVQKTPVCVDLFYRKCSTGPTRARYTQHTLKHCLSVTQDTQCLQFLHYLFQVTQDLEGYSCFVVFSESDGKLNSRFRC